MGHPTSKQIDEHDHIHDRNLIGDGQRRTESSRPNRQELVG
jgi:hypothetical protein